MRVLFIAIKYLTGINIGNLPDRGDLRPKDIALSASYFSFVGALMGCLLAAVYYLLGLIAADKAIIISAAVLIAAAVITEGMTLTSLMNVFNMPIAVCMLIAKFAIISSLTGANAFSALVLAFSAGRGYMVLAGKFYSALKKEPNVRYFMEFLGIRETVLSIVTLTLLAILVAGLKGWMILLLSFMILLAAAWQITKRKGGVNYDALWALSEITETSILFLFVVIPQS